jgi:hypothetical protein
LIAKFQKPIQLGKFDVVVWRDFHSFEFTTFSADNKMYDKNSHKDPWVAATIAALGAGVATSFAVAQGQSPFVALGITAFAAIVTVVCDRLGLV